MVKASSSASSGPEIIYDTSSSFTRPTYSAAASIERRNFMSSRPSDMYKKPKSGGLTNQLDSKNEELDIKKLFKEIEHLGAPNMKWKEKKALENRNVVALGGKPPKKQRVPLQVAKVIMKKQKEREKEQLQEGMIFGQFSQHGHQNKGVERRKAGDRVLKATKGHFSNGVLNVKHLLGGLPSSSRDRDAAPKLSKWHKKGNVKKGNNKRHC